jgi:hypothetical protein
MDEPRKVNEDLAKYFKDVNAYMMAAFGLRYSDVRADLDEDFAKAKASHAEGVHAEDFALGLGRAHGFKFESGVDAGQAREYNRYKAALAPYGRQAGWVHAADGNHYKQDGDALLRIEPVCARGGRWGFAVQAADGAELVETGSGRHPTCGDEDFETVATGKDIGEAYASFRSARPEADGFRLG